MKTMFDRVNEKVTAALAPLKRHPVTFSALSLLVVVALYVGGLMAVAAFTTETRLPLVLTGVYFLPAVLRAWLLFYWAARDEVRAVVKARSEKARIG